MSLKDGAEDALFCFSGKRSRAWQGHTSVPHWTTSNCQLTEGRAGAGWLARPHAWHVSWDKPLQGATHWLRGLLSSTLVPGHCCLSNTTSPLLAFSSVFLTRLSMLFSLLNSQCLEQCLVGARNSVEGQMRWDTIFQ